MTIRPATTADHDTIARICLLTGDAGADAAGKHGDDTMLADVYAMKRELLLFRRAAWPIRELMTALTRDGSDRFDPATMPYLRDAADHATQIVEVLESYRELAAGFVDVYLSSVANRTNEVMRVLTILATIFIPLTFIAGIYGMNFHDIPELHWRHGYAFFWAMCGVVTFGLLMAFRWLGWIAFPRRKR